MAKHHNTVYIDWITRGLAKPGKSKNGLAKALDIENSAVTRIVQGRRRIQLTEIDTIAAYIGEPPPDAPPSHFDAYGAVIDDVRSKRDTLNAVLMALEKLRSGTFMEGVPAGTLRQRTAVGNRR